MRVDEPLAPTGNLFSATLDCSQQALGAVPTGRGRNGLWACIEPRDPKLATALPNAREMEELSDRRRPRPEAVLDLLFEVRNFIS